VRMASLGLKKPQFRVPRHPGGHSPDIQKGIKRRREKGLSYRPKSDKPAVVTFIAIVWFGILGVVTVLVYLGINNGFDSIVQGRGGGFEVMSGLIAMLVVSVLFGLLSFAMLRTMPLTSKCSGRLRRR